MENYPMIVFYGESCNGLESTADHHVTTLTRIFRALADFGVTIEEEAIPGLNGAALQRWFNSAKKTLKPTTLNNYVVTLNPFLRWAHTIYPDTIADFSNVLHTVRLPSYDQIPDEEKPKDKYYTQEEVARLLEIPKHDSPLKKRDRAIIALFLATGLRVSELCQLTIGHLNARHGYVRVRRKGGAIKDVDVAEFAYEFINAYLKTREDADDISAPLFVTTHGTACNRKQVYDSMCARQKACGIDKALGAHVFRHTCLSDVEKIGGGAIARDIANHRSMAITNRYAHTTAEQRHEAINALRYGA